MAKRQQSLENRRRKPGVTLVHPRHMTPIIAGALSATIILHFLGLSLLDVLDVGLRLHPVSNSSTEDDRVTVIVTDDEDDIPVPLPPEEDEEPVEVVPIEDMEPVDFEDLPFEELVIAPGETEINLVNDSEDPMAHLGPVMNEDIFEKIKQGDTEPLFMENAAITDNPVQISVQPNEIDPDQWYKDQLEGAGGSDDVDAKGGSKSLNALLAMAPGTHGKGDYSRLGADLLFEYDKAVLKNSARVSLLKLAALIYKNPDTIFIIEGHTDSFGSRQYNAQLSLMRANAVRSWLKSNGIDMERIYIRPCGDSSPVVSTQGSREKQSANRRVEIHMRQKKNDLPEGVLPSSFPVDMDTPISEQLKNNPVLPVLPLSRDESGNIDKNSNKADPGSSDGKMEIPRAEPDIAIPDAESDEPEIPTADAV